MIGYGSPKVKRMESSSTLPPSLKLRHLWPVKDRLDWMRQQNPATATRLPKWPAEYVNSETGKPYRPHHEDEARAVYSDAPRYVLFKGGEGGGKSVAGIVKTLDRLRRGMSGVLVSKDFEHFKRSLWPEFRRWCPWEFVTLSQQYRQAATWEPTHGFSMVFRNELGGHSVLICGGAKESEIGSWEGPNVNFVHMDEMRHHRQPGALKTFDGRVRIPGPHGEPPQIWITTTPRKNWLFDYFGPLVEGDVRASFKREARVVTLLTRDNEPNLEPGFVGKRAQTLTEAEARVLLDAAWEDIEEGQRFLPSMLWWDACKEPLPALGPREPLVVALDAAVGRTDSDSDCFGVLAVSRHPARPKDCVAVRYCQTWRAKAGQKLDYQGTEYAPGPEAVLRWLCASYAVSEIVFDPFQLHDLTNRLRKEGLGWFREFPQGAPRLEADSDLLRLIQDRRIAHDGNPELRQHIANADRKLDAESKRLRIVKREDTLPVDLAVCLSMASKEALRLNL